MCTENNNKQCETNLKRDFYKMWNMLDSFAYIRTREWKEPHGHHVYFPALIKC